MTQCAKEVCAQTCAKVLRVDEVGCVVVEAFTQTLVHASLREEVGTRTTSSRQAQGDAKSSGGIISVCEATRYEC
jgi:hypothetical protein